MGFLDFLFGRTRCLQCGTKGARTSENRIRCRNPSCQYFDGTLGRGGVLRAAGSRFPRRSDYSPARPLAIRYRNFQGQEKTFIADRESLRRKHNHIIARVSPTAERISLSRDRIQNLADVEDALSQRVEEVPHGPTARERQVLAYHKKYKTTSPLYEKIRAKYPNW
jgi:hypothetical protein